MGNPVRATPEAARQGLQAGTSILVCAYSDEGMCKAMNLEGSITLQEFESRAPSLSKDQEIIFYCA